ncbi:N-acyl-D-amino-acid deacylase family protein [Sabulicella glaciei]|uniref:D-aminoacylase n=1 Tax=Sabulicella glaciei TaxID=2984948 RepID=A0ABT3NRZ2_9PROT|nr:D-aminoacylase [Roseococcus sp. MDT2-1-1]MCW8084927.1 D-aminoacylase [Roseococcus sp. MDT2-1-1]
MALRCDLVIRDATVLDGTGAPRFRADVAVEGDRIVSLGDLGSASGQEEVDAGGLALAPGFIDAHTHDDRLLLCGPECVHCKTSQGVTTVVVGNCGVSLAPLRMEKRPPPPLDLLGDESWFTLGGFGEYAEALAKRPTAVNSFAFCGHQSLRVEAMEGDVYRPATDREIARMQDRLRESLREGAGGFSTGLYYAPNMHAPTEEVIAVASVVAEEGGLYATHMRDEADGVMDSIRETLRTTREAGNIETIISHHKCSMPENFGRSRDTLALIDALGQDQPVAFDVYPYPAGSTVLMPERLRQDVPVQVTWSVPHPEQAGRNLDDIARDWGMTRRATAAKLLPAGAIYFQMDEADVRRIMAHPRAMIGSDGIPHDAKPHPRLWGTFPRVLGHYVREVGLFTLEAAVHKMTGRTAQVFGLPDRGTIRPGGFADLVLFDPATVRDHATYENPDAISEGIRRVWCNGVETFREGQAPTGAGPGRFLGNPRLRSH